MTIDVAAVRVRLTDPAGLCAALGLMKGSKRQARGVIVSCPVHDDRTPSCSVRVADDGTIACRCHGCGWTGDAIALVGAVRRVEGRAMLEAAAELANVTEAPTRPAPEAPRRAAPMMQKRTPDVLDLSGALAPIDPDGPVARYLADRHIFDLAAREGWLELDATEIDYQIEERLGMGGEPLDLVAGGLVRRLADGWTVHMPEHRLVIPWRDPRGDIDTIQRRAIGPHERRYTFPSGRAPRYPYGVDRLRAGKPVALTEGALDAGALRALDALAGIDRDVLGVPGTGGWKEEWGALLADRVVHIATDRDAAGDDASTKWAAMIRPFGPTKIMRLRPHCGDWAEALAAERTR